MDGPTLNNYVLKGFEMFVSNHFTDADGNLAGGNTYGTGFAIGWQHGPLKDPETGERKEPTGAFVENVIEAAIDRIEFYQDSKFASGYNETALEYLRKAVDSLNARTRDREQRGVEGTHNT